MVVGAPEVSEHTLHKVVDVCGKIYKWTGKLIAESDDAEGRRSMVQVYETKAGTSLPTSLVKTVMTATSTSYFKRPVSMT